MEHDVPFNPDINGSRTCYVCAKMNEDDLKQILPFGQSSSNRLKPWEFGSSFS